MAHGHRPQEGTRRKIRRRAAVLQGLDRQAQGGRLDRPDQLDRGAPHGLRRRSAFRPAGARGRTRHRRHHARDPGARRQARESLLGRVFGRFRAPPRGAVSGRQRHQGRCLRSRRDARRQARHDVRFRRLRRAAAQLPGGAAHRATSRTCSAASRRAARSCSSPMARCRRCRPAAATTRSSIIDFVLRNIPPTQLWVYRRPAA